MFGILCVQRDVSRRNGQQLANDRTREPDPPIIASNRPDICHIGNTTFWCLAEANLFKNLKDGILNGIHRSAIKRAKCTASHASSDWTQFIS